MREPLALPAACAARCLRCPMLALPAAHLVVQAVSVLPAVTALPVASLAHILQCCCLRRCCCQPPTPPPPPLLPPLQVKEAHRRIMIANHPDAGGSSFIAAKVNEAKDMMLGKRRSGGSVF